MFFSEHIYKHFSINDSLFQNRPISGTHAKIYRLSGGFAACVNTDGYPVGWITVISCDILLTLTMFQLLVFAARRTPVPACLPELLDYLLPPRPLSRML